MIGAAKFCCRLWAVGVLSALALLTSPALALADGLPATVLKIRPSSRVVSPRLSSLPQASWAKAPQDLKLIPAPMRPGAHAPAPSQPSASDRALQTKAGPHLRIEPKTSFSGLGENGAIPPDPNIAVGQKYVVQTVNLAIGIWDKSKGTLVPGYPKQLGSLWTGVSGCDTSNSDPVVLYDKLAPDGLGDGGTGRWVITQIGPIQSTPYSECVAVSATSDPTGSYYLYSYSFGSTYFDDYPKLSVWPTQTNSAYAASFNMFEFEQIFSGNYICVLNRDALLAGAVHPVMLCHGINYDGSHFYSFLPADLDGATPPPDGSPAYFLSMGTSSSLLLYGVKPDWTTDPSNPTITVSGPINIPVDSYTATCGDGGSCVPQPGTSQQLASLGDRMMYRLAYRNFGNGDERMVVNHSVQVGSSIGVRWYELRKSVASSTQCDPNSPDPWSNSGAVYVCQEGTFAGSPPDSAYRWMGSAAMDAAGDIALGYSLSDGASIYPSIAYTGQLAGDPIDTMRSETVLQPGQGSQTGPYARWGDYTSMRIDPSDDTTFWYTNEYYQANSSYQWGTYIGSFKLADSSSTAPTCSLTASPTGIAQGGSSTLSWSTTDATGFSIDNGLGTEPLSGSTTVSPSATTTYTGTVTGAGGQATCSTTVTVSSSPPPSCSLTASPTGITQGGSSTLSWSTTNAAGFSIDNGLGTEPLSGSTTVSPSATTTYTGTVTGAGGQATCSATVTVSAPSTADFSLSVSPSPLSVRRGSSAQTTVSVTLISATSSVNLVVTGLPKGVSASFSSDPVATPGSTILTLSAHHKTSNGTYTLTITGANGSATHSTTLDLTVTR